MPEAWTTVPGYEGRYQVNEEGQVRSLPRRRTRGGILKSLVNKRGYLTVTLGATKREVHKIVAETFLGPRPEGMEIRHLDGNPLNPAVINLAYGTRSENNRDKRQHGTDHNVIKTHCPRGHEYTPENIRRVPSRPGQRYCRACEAFRIDKRRP